MTCPMFGQAKRQLTYLLDLPDIMDHMSTKQNPLDGLVKTRGNYVLNQKSAKFADRRTKRNRTRGAQNRRAIQEAC